MGNEYTPHYAGKSHQQLWNELMAGDPKQVDGVSAEWSKLESDTRHIAGEIDKDLAKLDWKGDAGREYQYRLGLVSGYSTKLADDHATVRSALDGMSVSLRTAQENADDPEDTDDNASMVGGVVIGGLSGGLTGAVVGGFLGHQRDEQQKKEAHARMVQLMSNLAADYGVQDSSVTIPTAPPTELPGGDVGADADPKKGPRGSSPHTVPGTHKPGTDQTHDTGTFVPVSTVGPTGTGEDPPGTQLTGADTGIIGAGVIAAGGALTGQLVTLTGGTGPGLGPTTALAGGVPAGGLLGGTGGGGGTGVTGARPGSETSLQSNAGRSGAVAPGAERGPAATRGGGLFGNNGQRGAGGPMARTGSGEDEDEERYDTWLTEDDMVWSDDENAPPPVLGGGGQSEPPAGGR
ncbi:WXG100 family type VII secretion target [Dactylosporangium sucinum]|uniref:WXG100 family type VII secretion target n=1 Tax=Dactylosporangium sucinum TaxID=1424081 RepID=A0A917T2A1_9ACTN|nr:hypothetical protein [Dactylosporangium sucinum]GGM05745.1 hypothetical protein GCM10007977_003610 [Dactylosporangium sucinum]